MRLIQYFSIALITMFFSIDVFANDPEGWKALKDAIEKTAFNDVSKLQGRTFDLVIPGGTNEYQLGVEPENAFRVERLAPDKFRLTVISPQALVKQGPLLSYHPIGWSLKKKDPFTISIEGAATCSYEVVFRQTGAGELDLSKFEADYDITYEISNQSAISSISRQGKGYLIMRVPNAQGETKMRLRMKKKSGDEDLMTGWIVIPACKTGEVPLVPKPQDIPVTPSVAPEPASGMITLKTEGISFCQESTGLYCSTLTVKATNIGSRTVRCNSIWFHMIDGDTVIGKTQRWVELNAGQSTIFEVVIKSTYRPASFSFDWVKTDCFYK
ncbi:hypothetical protein QFZ20_004392 [Flavobacterium sp. W4I14]|nr:hypothetical protein [Flavobacterium sp. W4I14]